VVALFRANFLLQNVVISTTSPSGIATAIQIHSQCTQVSYRAALGYPEFDRYRDQLDEAVVFDQ